MEQKNIALYVILTVITCGLFGLYWFYSVAKNYEDMQLPGNVTTTAGVSLLLNLVTCGIYGMYCYYKWGVITPELFARYGKQGEDKSIMYLILAIFNLSLINLCLIQSDLNDLLGNNNAPPTASYGGGSGGYPPYAPTAPSYQNPNTDPGFAAPTAQPPCPPIPEAPLAPPPTSPTPPTPPTPPAPPAYRS